MRSRDVKTLAAYSLVSALAVSGAFAVSLRFIGSLRAQTPPAPNAAQTPAQNAPQNPAAPDAQAPAALDPNNPNNPANAAAGQPGADMQGGSLANATHSGIAELEGFLEPFIYDVANRRDPFMPFSEFSPADEGPMRALTPAQRYALEDLRLVGVMWDIKDPKAMFMDPDEEVLVLGRDESIGNRNGYIAAIREGEVVVVEAIRKRGDIIYRTRVLRIER